MKSSYGDFASVYDALVKDVDYKRMIETYQRIFKQTDLRPELVLDLGCGTGNITLPMARLGYDMIGVDASVEMLNVARQRAAAENLDILFLNQEMQSFELYGTVDAVISALDSMNYVTERMDEVFRLVNNYLNPGGLFLFDINTIYKLKHIIGEHTYVYDDENVFYTWQSDYEAGLCDFYLTFFVKDGSNYRRFDEVHTERAYSEEEIERLLQKYGFLIVEKSDGDTGAEVTAKSQRIFYAARKGESSGRIKKSNLEDEN